MTPLTKPATAPGRVPQQSLSRVPRAWPGKGGSSRFPIWPLDGRRTVRAARSADDSMAVQAGGTLTAAQPGTGGKRGRRDAGHAV